MIKIINMFWGVIVFTLLYIIFLLISMEICSMVMPNMDESSRRILLISIFFLSAVSTRIILKIGILPGTNYTVTPVSCEEHKVFHHQRSTVQALEETFNTISKKVRGKNVDYILNVCTRNDMKFQFVHPAKFKGGSSDFGFAIHLTFDNESEGLRKLKKSAYFKRFTHKDWQGIPCYYVNLGDDPKEAATMCSQILVDIYSVSDYESVDLELYEEGQL